MPKKSEKRFIEALMKSVLDGTMVSKLQVERALAPIIGFFIESILAESLGTDVVMLSPEFPLKKYDKTNHSENIDWMMLDVNNKELLLVEFKANDKSFGEAQMESYKKLQKVIYEKGSSSFLIDDLEKIRDKSVEHGKYTNTLLRAGRALGIDGGVEEFSDLLKEKLAQYKRAKIIYLAPKLNRPKNWIDGEDMYWISFDDLPRKIDHEYSDYWEIIRLSIQILDFHSRDIRNGDDGRNYVRRLSLGDMLDLCLKEGSKIQVGFVAWSRVKKSITAEELRKRLYKYDYVDHSIGRKVEDNWVPGDQFLEEAIQILSRHI